jgi:hypothetical protein
VPHPAHKKKKKERKKEKETLYQFLWATIIEYRLGVLKQ